MNIIFQKYSFIFKVGLALITIALIGLSQPFLTLMSVDYKAKESQFVIEAQENKKIDEINCNNLKENIAKCNFTKYQLNENKEAINIAAWIIVSSFILGLLCFPLPIIYHLSTNHK